jgi:hypothetical protein
MLMSHSNRASIVSYFFLFLLFYYLRSSRTIVLYFICFINETHTVGCGSLKK